jgi:hypothetical protein
MFDLLPSMAFERGTVRGRGSSRAQGKSIGSLLDEYRRIRRRYGPIEEDALIDRVQSSVAARRARLQMVRRQIDELRSEERWLADELNSREQSLEMLLGDVITRLGSVVEDGWSPFPVLGFRMWTMRPGGLHGAKVTWREPNLTARCLVTRDDVGVPHADGRCGRLGCGVYATKELRPLLTAHIEAHSYGYVVGLVALTGRVVEHEHGYRAEQARIVALVAVGADRLVATDEPGLISDICSTPEATVAAIGRAMPDAIVSSLEDYLVDVRARRTPWTSVDNDG